MKRVRINNRLLPVLFLLVASAAIALSVENDDTLVQSGSPAMKITLSGTVVRASGSVAIDKAGPVNPGEVINYTIRSNNEGPNPARDYKAIGPIPARTVYVEGSAKAEGASAVYSVDGGKYFSAKPMIDQRQPDGSIKKVPAPVAMYTHIRFDWATPLAAHSHCSASYQVRIK